MRDDFIFKTIGENTLCLEGVNPNLLLKERVLIPELFNGKRVVEIAAKAFQDQTEITEVVIPNSVNKIGNGAFKNCTALINITIPNEAKLGSSIFYGCRSLKSVQLPQGIEVLGAEEIDSIYYGFFEKCSSLEQVFIPSSVKVIDNNAFKKCFHLNSILLPSSLRKINQSAFSYCTSLEEISIPEGIRELFNTFTDCISLKRVHLPSSLKKMSFTFCGCTNLQSIYLPEGVEKVDGLSFGYCFALKRIEVSEKNNHFTSAQGVLYSKDLKRMVIYPAGREGDTYSISEGTKVIAPHCFIKTRYLKKVITPNSLKRICDDAF